MSEFLFNHEALGTARSLRILIVDDQEMIRRSVRSLLSPLADLAICGEAADGLEAVVKTKEFRPDLVLMDISMPRMDGLQASRIIRCEVPESDIILVSQNDPAIVCRQAAEVGARAFVTKSYLARDLLPTIEKIAAERGADNVNLDEEATIEQRADNLLASIVDSSDDAIVSKNLDGMITSWNKGAERIFGYTAEEAVGQHITIVLPVDRRQEEIKIVEQLKRGERVDHFEAVRVRKDGKEVDVSLTISPVKGASGRVIGASKVARDITERKRTERALADGARRQDILFQLADRLHRAQSIDDIYSCALGAILGSLPCDRAAILRCDDMSVMRFIRWQGLSDTYRNAVEGHSAWRSDEKAPRPVSIDNINSAEIADAVKAAVRAEGIGALAFIPLVRKGMIIGKFMAYFNAPHAFNDVELSLCLTIARQVAFALERTTAEEALRASEERFRTLSETLDAEVRVRTSELEKRSADIVTQSEQLRELSWRLLRIQDEERRHIARELHDSAGQTLAVLGMNVARLVQEAKEIAPQLAKDAEETQELAQQLTQEIRTTSYLLHPPMLDENGLSAAVGWYVRGLAERSGLEIKLSISDDFGRLPRDIELVVFRLIQECLTNIHRHSGSKSAEIHIARDADSVSLDVQDEGKGISPEKLARLQSEGSGVGIRGMRERVRQFHGQMSIDSSNAGTRISATIPIPKGLSGEPPATLPLKTAV